MRIATISVFLLVASMIPDSAASQGPIPSGARVRLQVCAPGCMERVGQYLGVDRSTLALYPSGANRPQRYGLFDITSLAVYRGNIKNRRVGASIGALAAGIIGGVLFFSSTGECQPVGVFCGVSTGAAYAGMIGSAVVGGAIGAAVGIRVERWEEIRIPGMRLESLRTPRLEAGLRWRM